MISGTIGGEESQNQESRSLELRQLSGTIPKTFNDPESCELSANRKPQNHDEDEKQDNSYMDETGLTEFEADYHSGKVMDVRKFDAELEELDRGITICNKARNFIIYGVCLIGMVIVLYKLGSFVASTPKKDLAAGETGEFIMDSFTVGYYLLEKFERLPSTSDQAFQYTEVGNQKLFVQCFSGDGVAGLNIFELDETNKKLTQLDTARMQPGDVGGSCSVNRQPEPNTFGVIQTVIESKKIYGWHIGLQDNKPGTAGLTFRITQTTKILAANQLTALFQVIADDKEEYEFIGALGNVKDGLVFLSSDLEKVVDSKPVKLLDNRRLGIKVVSITSVYSPSRLVILPDHLTQPDQLLVVNTNNGNVIKRIDVSGLRSRIGQIVQDPRTTPLTSITSDSTGALYLTGLGWPVVVKIRVAARHFKLGH